MRHLSDEEIFGLLAEGGGAEAGHLEGCAHCRARYERLAEFVAAAVAPPGPEPDWEAQRAAVMAALSRPHRGWLRAPVALAAGLLLAVGLSYLAGRGPSSPGPQQQPQGVYGEQGLAMLDWRGDEAPAGEFDSFVEFVIPISEEDDNETVGDVGLSDGGAPAGGTGLA